MRFFTLLLLCLPALPLAGQIDVLQYASDDLFAVKPVVSSEIPAEEAARHESWSQKKFESAWKHYSEDDLEAALADLDELIDYNESVPYFHYLQGVMYMESEMPDEARRKLNDALNVDPLFLEAKYQLGMLALSEDDTKTAKEYFTGLTELKQYAAMGYHGLGYEAIQKNNAYGAIRDFKRSIEADPTFTDSYGTLAVIELVTGNLRQCEKVIQQGVTANPDWEEGIVMGAIISLLIHEDLEAFDHDLDRLISMSPDNYHYLFLKAAVMIEKGEYHKAIEQYRAAYEMDTVNTTAYHFTSKISKEESLKQVIDYFYAHYPEDTKTRNLIEEAMCEMITKETADALETIKIANRNNPTATGFMLQGVLEENRYSQRSEAIDTYTRALELDSMNSYVLARRGDLLVKEKNFEAAYLDFDKLVKLHPKEKEAWKQRGIMLSQINYPRHAYRDFSTAIALDTTDMEVFFNRATMAYQLKSYNEAEMDLNFLLRFEPDDGEAWYMLHSLDLARGDTLKALSRLDSASTYLRFREEVHKELLAMAMDLENDEVTESALTRLIRSNRRDHNHLLERGKFYYHQQRYEEARKDLEEYTDLLNRSGNGYYYLSKVYAALGDENKSDRNMKKAEKYGYIPEQ